MQVGLVGRGQVGQRVERLFGNHGTIVAWDVRDVAAYPERDFARSDFIVVCVGTPAASTGAADVSAVDEAVARVPHDRILLKSTVPPGTCARLGIETGKQICYWPEYTGDSRYHNPYFPARIEDVPFVILGGEPEVRRWFIDALLPVLGPTKRYFQCDSQEAELIKYAENAFFALKVSFVNEYRRICEVFGSDWHTVREGWLLDPRVSPMHTAAFAEDRGFGGTCLPKDVDAIVAASETAGYDPALLRQVSISNKVLRAGHLPAFGAAQVDVDSPHAEEHLDRGIPSLLGFDGGGGSTLGPSPE